MIFASRRIMQCSEKTMKNVRKYRDIKLVTTERRRKFII